jgi:FkbM family methyltransferase
MSALKEFRRSFVDKIFKVLDKTIPSRAERDHGTLCFSQTGEDGILNCFLPSQGFYIDVGAHHPLRYSNTHMLYRRGWRGINIDPTPGSMTTFEKFRQRDTNLEIAISRSTKKRRLYVFEEGGYNTFDKKTANGLLRNKKAQLLMSRIVPCLSLKEVCRKYVPTGQNIGLLTVDAEGHDVEILESHDWVNYRPTVVVAEQHHQLGKWKNPTSFLRKRGYSLVGQTPFSVIFQDTNPSSKKE